MKRRIICNFDGLVGPTHNYAGLAKGNFASMKNANMVSNPKEAALQGLELMRTVLGIVGMQGFLPPHARPNFEFLARNGLGSHEANALEKGFQKRSELFAAAWSSSAMWTANAATVTQTDLRHVHITPANLLTMIHRQQELKETTKNLKMIFHKKDYYTLHPSAIVHDEGAANHMYIHGIVDNYDIFVYSSENSKYPGRQKLKASQLIAQRHDCKRPIFIEQSEEAINSGAFHNDVVAVSHNNYMIYHEKAFTDDSLLPDDILKIKIPDKLLSLEEAVKSYLFNMRIVTNEDFKDIIIACSEVQESPAALQALDYIMEKNSQICEVRYVDIRQSMANGGGPACLRLRVPVINPDAVDQRYMLNHEKIDILSDFIKENYRDRLELNDMRDVDFAHEVLEVQEKLLKIFDA